MTHLSQQTAASLRPTRAKSTLLSSSLPQKNEQLHHQQQLLMQQMEMLTTNANVPRTKITASGVRTNYPTTITHPPTQIYAPPPLQGLQQQQPNYPPRGGGQGGGRSRHDGCGQRGRGQMPPPQIQYPTIGGTSIIPYIPAGFQPRPHQCNPDFSNIVKVYANQNVCFL